MAITFMSSKDNEEEGAMHSKKGKIDIMSYDKADEAIEQLSRYQIGLETSMKGAEFVFRLCSFVIV